MRILTLSLIAIAGWVPFASAQNWSAWRPDETYHGIEVRARCTGFNEYAGRTVWDVQLRNRYQKPVDVAWAAEPQRLRGAEAQADRAMSVAPGETVDAHHTAPVDCSAGLNVRVNAVRTAEAQRASAGPGNPNMAQAAPPAYPPQPTPSNAPGPEAQPRPMFQGHWQSKDPDQAKSFTFEYYGDTIAGHWSSPGFNLQITTPFPKNLLNSIQVGPAPEK